MSSRIAVVGVSALFPGSRDAASFWSNIVAGKDMMTEVPPTHWLIDDYYDPDPQAPDKTYSRRGAFLPRVPFNALEFGIPPSSLPAIDSSQLLALMTAQAVLSDAAQKRPLQMNRERVSVILGVASGTELFSHMAGRLQRPSWQKGLRDLHLPEDLVQRACDSIAAQFVPWQENTFPGLLGNVVAGRIANRLDLGGTNCVVDAACASSLSAISMGINELALGQADMVIAGGVDAANDPTMYMCFSKTPALSRTGDCRPFSADADGTMMGEGMAMFALRRLEDAERDGDAIYGVIAAVGSSSDGKSKSVYAPLSAGQAKALRRTYARAGYGPDTVELLEAHGTGTRAGDTAEFNALREVFGAVASGNERGPWCALGSVKSQVGHTKAAAGAAGLFKALMALRHRVLPPTLKISRPNPDLGIETSPFYLNTAARPWIANALHPRRASLSAFGFGGANFHVTLEEYTGPAPRPKRFRSHPAELLLFSGGSCAEVTELCRVAREEAREGASAEQLARTNRGAFREDAPARLALVVEDETSLLPVLNHAMERLETQPSELNDASGIFFQQGSPVGHVAFLFPGQGSQYVNMGADLANEFEQVRAIWDAANKADFATSDGGQRLADAVFPHPVFRSDERALQEAWLRGTERAQPALAVTSLGFLELLLALGITPAAVAGHSFGELTALHAAGVLEGPDFLRLACKRGELMAAATGRDPGAMTAVVASLQEVQKYIRLSGSGATVANINAPRQIVVSGDSRNLDALERVLSSTNVSFQRLPVAAAFHSTAVAAASEHFLQELAEVPFHPSSIPIFSNTEVLPYNTADPERCRSLLASQICRPVRFAEQIQAMYASGIRLFLEVGPGSTLTGLIGKCLAGKPYQAISMDSKGIHGVLGFWYAVARLAAAGVPVQLDALLASFRPRSEASIAKAGLVVNLCGSNYGRPYPPSPSAAWMQPGTAPGAVGPDRSASTAAASATTSTAHDASSTTHAVLPAASTPDFRNPSPIAKPMLQASPNFKDTMTKEISQHPTSLDDLQGSPLPVLLDLQRQIAEAHVHFQRAMTEGHTAYLRTVESLYVNLAGSSAVFAPPLQNSVETALPTHAAKAEKLPADTEVSQPAKQEVSAAAPAALPPLTVSAVSNFNADQPSGEHASRFFPQNGMAKPREQVMQPAPFRTPTRPVNYAEDGNGVVHQMPTAAVADKEANRADLQAKLFAVIADKTGYPADVLDPNMDIEADLGIDSIKRVEILSTFRQAAPGLLEIKAHEVASLRTLAEILDRSESTSMAAERRLL